MLWEQRVRGSNSLAPTI